MLTATNLIANGIGKKIGLSGKNRIQEGTQWPEFGSLSMIYEGPVNASLSEDTLDISASSLSGRNGMFIRNKDDKVTMGLLLKDDVLISDQFGGCDFAILKNPQGVIVGAHVFSSDECRACIAKLPPGWSEICTWKSDGYIAKWQGIGALIAFAFVDSKHVRIVIVGVGGYPGKITHVEDYGTFDR